MGIETALALGLAAGGTYMQMDAQNDAEKRRIAEMQRNAQQMKLKQQEADARVNQEIKDVNASTPEQERAEANAAFLTQLRRTKGDAINTSGAGGSQFQSDLEGASKSVDQFGRAKAATTAGIAAPVRQRTREAVGMNRLATDIDTIQRFASGDDFLSQLRMNNIRANPWQMAAGGLIAGAGSGLASTGGAMPKNPTYTKGTPAYRRNNYGYEGA